MTRADYRRRLLKRCGSCAMMTSWCSVVQDKTPEQRGYYGCDIEEEWRWFLKLGMPPESWLEKMFDLKDKRDDRKH